MIGFEIFLRKMFECPTHESNESYLCLIHNSIVICFPFQNNNRKEYFIIKMHKVYLFNKANRKLPANFQPAVLGTFINAKYKFRNLLFSLQLVILSAQTTQPY